MLTRDQLRNRRQREVRARTENLDRAPKRTLPGFVEEHPRPQRRGDCENGPRPCPYVGCRYHLYLDVTRDRSIKYNFPDLEVWELRASCALDVADQGGITLDTVGALMNVTRERARQIEARAVARCATLELQEQVEDDDRTPIRQWHEVENTFQCSLCGARAPNHRCGGTDG